MQEYIHLGNGAPKKPLATPIKTLLTLIFLEILAGKYNIYAEINSLQGN